MSEDVTLSTGVKVRLTRPSSSMLGEIMAEMHSKRPAVPQIMNSDKGRMEDNPSDPDYQNKVQLWLAQVTESTYQASVALGCKIIEIPEDMAKSESEDFFDILDLLGIPKASSKIRRTGQWLKFVGAPTDEDWLIILKPIMEKLGVFEQAVAEATKFFRSNAERAADRGLSDQGNHTDRDRIHSTVP